MERIYFNAADGVELNGLLEIPEKKTEDIIISVHGMTSNCLNKREDVIGREAKKRKIAYLSFNNRGQEIARYTKKYDDSGKKEKRIVGTAFEDVLDGYYDIKGAIQYAIDLGYENIYLQGHSLGCTKIVYTYQLLKKQKETEILDKIKKVILLSLIDIQGVQRLFLGNSYSLMLEYALNKEAEGKTIELMPEKAFLHPISVGSYLRYFKYNQEIHFARYGEEEYTYPELNAIQVPLMMRFGNDKEMVIQKMDVLIPRLKEKIKNKKLNVGYIDGANHSYQGKEDILAKEIMHFIEDRK